MTTGQKVSPSFPRNTRLTLRNSWMSGAGENSLMTGSVREALAMDIVLTRSEVS